MSDLYTKIEAASRRFVTSAQITPEKPYDASRVSTSVTNARTPDALHSWRPNHFVANNPKLPKGKVDNQAFLDSLATFLPAADTFEPKVHDIVVDTRALKSTIQASFFLKLKGTDVVVEDDVVFVFTFKEVGEEVKIVESVEYVDGTAVGAIGQLLAQAKA